MNRRIPDTNRNRPFARVIVTERDGKRQRIRVRYTDEDATQSFWVDVPGRGAAENASFDMPDEGDEGWVGMDSAGEAGVWLGTRYNKTDSPPTTDPDVAVQRRRDGATDTHDPGAGTRTIDLNGGTLTLVSGGSSIVISPGGIQLRAPRIDHNECPPLTDTTILAFVALQRSWRASPPPTSTGAFGRWRRIRTAMVAAR